MMRVGRWLLALFLLALLTGLGTGGLWLPGLVQREAVQWMASAHHQRLTMGVVQVTPYPLHLHVEQVRLYEPDGITEELGLKALDVTLSWRSLWHAMPVLDSVILTQPVVHLVRADNGQWNVAAWASSSSSSGGLDLPVLVDNIRLSGGEVTVSDSRNGWHHALHDVNIEIPLWATQGLATDRWVDMKLGMRVDEAPLKLNAQCQLGPHWKVRGEVDADRVDVNGWLAPWLPLGSLRSVSGTVAGHSDFLVESVAGAWQATLRQLIVHWQGGELMTNALAVRADSVQWVVSDAHLSSHRMTWRKSTLTGKGLSGERVALPASLLPVWHIHSADGSLEVGQMKAEATPAESWTVVLQSPQLQLSPVNTGCVGERKNCQSQPFRLALNTLQAGLNEFHWPLSGAMILNGQGEMGNEGRISVTGPWDSASGALDLQLTATHIPLSLAQPFLVPYARLLIDRGNLALHGNLLLGEPHYPGRIRYHGWIQADELTLRDQQRAQLLWRSKTLYLGGADVAINPLSVTLDQVAISDFYARVMLMPDGSLNLKSLFDQAARGHKPESVVISEPVGRRDSKSLPPPIEIHKVTLQGGRVQYKDQFVHPTFEADLTHLTGVMTGLSSRQQADAVVDWRGRVNGAPLQIKGTLNPLAATTHLDLNAQVSGMDLSMFSPYAGKYVGYDIERGKLSFDVTYHLQDGNLKADNHLILNQLTFGKPVPSATAAHLPVELAASLLKDAQGNINVNLPIEGSLNDPQFSVGEILAKMLVHMLEHAVESPLGMLEHWFEHRDAISWLTFAPGSDVVAEDQQSRLTNMLRSLQDQPHARLDLQGCFDGESDGLQLQRQVFMKKILAARRRAQPDFQGSQFPDRWPAADYAHWLEKAYQAESFPKPKTLLGFDRALSVSDMEKLMMAYGKVSQGQLEQLAQHRVEAVQQWFHRHGIGMERLYPVRGSAQDRNIGENVSRARVDLILHP